MPPNAQISAVAGSVTSLGLQFTADPTRLFGRVTGIAKQWQSALGAPLSTKAATASSPFITYSLPGAHRLRCLQPVAGQQSCCCRSVQVYDPTAEGHRTDSG